MILQIACRCGLPPSVIADTWSPAELRQAEALAYLEGWGQEKRRTAAILAELHNVSRIEAWAKSIDPKRPSPAPPKLLNEGHFLPKRVKRAAAIAKVQAERTKAVETLSSVMNSLCGF